MILLLIAIVMFVLIVASTWWFGLWSNTITLINLLIASMLASSTYEPVAQQLVEINSTYRAVYDFIAIWLVFCLSFFILRAITDVISAFRLKFDRVTEMIGRSILSIWIACVFICFSFFTLQMAPFTPAIYGSETMVNNPAELGTLPDKLWLAFIQSRSRGALSAGQEAGWGLKAYNMPVHPDDVELNSRVFDPNGNFLFNMESRRWALSKKKNIRGN